MLPVAPKTSLGATKFEECLHVIGVDQLEASALKLFGM